MSDQEWMVRLQFLEEAQEYLDEMESALLGLGSQKLAREALDRILRAAHSIKGGSALMGFEALSQVAHRLEDFFKVLQGGRYEPSAGLERLFLGTVDQMRQQVGCDRQRDRSNSAAIARQAKWLLNQLYDILGDPTPEDEQASLSVDAGGEDMAVLMFEGEIGPCLDRLQGVLADPDLPLLRQEFLIACPEMGSLGEMLDLGQFSQLCNHGEALVRDCHEAELMAVCEAVLKALRRSHGLVLVGQAGLIPETVSWPSESQAAGLPERLELGEGWASPDVPEIAPAALPESISQDSLGERDSQQPTALELELEALFSDGFSLDGQELAHQPSPTALEPLDSPPVSDAEIGPEIWPEIQPAPAPAAIAEPPSPAIPEEAGDALAPPASSQHQPDPDLQSGSSKDATVRVSLRKLERLGELLGELTTERNSLGLQLNYLTSLFALLGDRVHSLDRANGLLRQSYDRSATEQVAIANSAEAAIAPDPAIAQNLARFDRLEMDHYGNLHWSPRKLSKASSKSKKSPAILNWPWGKPQAFRENSTAPPNSSRWA
ncbi:MAG: hypothetical protein HC824_15885 [Synechococcales cyanobacterium RM1_1_8]|nr:hypothetical protein [Synechococcales cyanobacterium RM1_1_8]